ncbi:hypothetical protein LP420_29395 [Massilia sp. B-10]|nr:hypothetical protein LP420_29395 [Massilia sp. B-10]
MSDLTPNELRPCSGLACQGRAVSLMQGHRDAGIAAFELITGADKELLKGNLIYLLRVAAARVLPIYILPIYSNGPHLKAAMTTLVRNLARSALLLLVTACTMHGADKVPSASADDEITRAAAEIDRRIEYENKHPFKTFISPNTRNVGYATYYKAAGRRIEEVGTHDFPQKDGKKLYGALILYIPIYQDGSLYMRDGGPKIEKARAMPISIRRRWTSCARLRRSGAFPPHMLSPSADDVWVMVSGFTFKHGGSAAPRVDVVKQ